MRTTVTLDKDVEKMLRTAMHKQRRSFKETLNSALRSGLAGKPDPSRAVPFKVLARPLGLRAGIDPSSFNKLAGDLEVKSRTAKRPRR